MPRGVHPDKLALYEQGLKRCPHCGIVKPFDAFQASRTHTYSGVQCRCRDCRRKIGREFYERIRIEALRRYSVTPYPSCVCCSETIVQFLGLDHINGGGREHRKSVGSGFGFYRWLRKNGWPDGFQTMCHNCNQAKGAWGKCPHELE